MTRLLDKAAAFPPSDLLFGLAAGSPYYILTSTQADGRRYDEAAFTLCHALNVLGQGAYIAGPTRPQGTLTGGGRTWRTAELTSAIVDRHYQAGRSPIVVAPPGGEPQDCGGLTVCLWGLSDAGICGSWPTRSSDVVVTGSPRAAAAVPGGAQVLAIPVCDPEFWRPDVDARAEGPCAVLPTRARELRAGTGLPRTVRTVEAYADSLSPFRLRELLCTSPYVYAFADVGLADRARLCGCPVVVSGGSAMAAALADSPHGLLGCTFEDSKALLSQARYETAAFRAAYLESLAGFGAALAGFIELTQQFASLRLYTRKVSLSA